MGLVTQHNAYMLSARPESLYHPSLPPNTSPAYRNLDVTLLHTFIIDPVMRENSPAPILSYVKDPEEPFAAVRAGNGLALFLLNATQLDQVLAVARAGEKMPHKATYFYPKVYSGIVMRKIG